MCIYFDDLIESAKIEYLETYGYSMDCLKDSSLENLDMAPIIIL